MRYRGALAVQESDEAIIHHHMRSLCESLGNEPSQLGSIELMRSTEPLRGEPIPTTILALGDAAESEPERHVDQGQTLDDGVLVETALALENDDVNEEEYVFVNQDLAQYDDMQCAVTSAVRNGYPMLPKMGVEESDEEKKRKEQQQREDEGRNGLSGNPTGVILDGPTTPTELGRTQSLFINESTEPYEAAEGHPEHPILSIRLVRRRADLEAKQKFMEQLKLDVLVMVATSDASAELHAWATRALLSGAQNQLAPRPGLLARLAKDTELKTLPWLHDFLWFGRNRDFLLHSAAKSADLSCQVSLKQAYEDERAERELMKICLGQCGCVIQFTRWSADAEMVHLSLQNDVRAFRFASERIRDDFATAVAVVARNGMLLEFASARLRADRALIQAAVCQNVFAFQFARLESADLRAFAATEVLKKLGVTGEADTSDAGWLREFCLEGVKQEPSFYKALSASEQLDMEIATAAVRLDPCLFPHDLPKEIRSCFNIQVAAVAKNVSLKYFVLPSDRVLVEKAAAACGKVPYSSPNNPFLHSLLRTSQSSILQLLAGEAEPGDEARRVEWIDLAVQNREKFLMTKCSAELRGRILDPEGRPLDGLPMPEKVESRQIFMKEKPKEEQGVEEKSGKTQVLETLAKTWTKLPGVEERGASGRIIVAGNHLTRPDLDANWNIVAAATEALGSRPTVYAIGEAVEHFFYLTRRSSSSLPDVASDGEDADDPEAG
ncbi:unnamed protein product [Symbiodinium sp. KB8]|nr:unnamed protein product [Symbiodinium sp. KB8]